MSSGKRKAASAADDQVEAGVGNLEESMVGKKLQKSPKTGDTPSRDMSPGVESRQQLLEWIFLASGKQQSWDVKHIHATDYDLLLTDHRSNREIQTHNIKSALGAIKVAAADRQGYEHSQENSNRKYKPSGITNSRIVVTYRKESTMKDFHAPIMLSSLMDKLINHPLRKIEDLSEEAALLLDAQPDTDANRCWIYRNFAASAPVRAPHLLKPTNDTILLILAICPARDISRECRSSYMTVTVAELERRKNIALQRLSKLYANGADLSQTFEELAKSLQKRIWNAKVLKSAAADIRANPTAALRLLIPRHEQAQFRSLRGDEIQKVEKEGVDEDKGGETAHNEGSGGVDEE